MFHKKMDVNHFIDCVFSRTALWDRRDVQHRNTFVLNKLWEEVAKEMKLTRKLARTKWKSLRDTYRKEVKKILEKQSGDDASQFLWESSWPYFDSLSFLRNQFTNENSSSDVYNDNDILQEDASITDAILYNDSDYQLPWQEEKIPLMTSSKPGASRSVQPHEDLKWKQPEDIDIGTALVLYEDTSRTASADAETSGSIQTRKNLKRKQPDDIDIGTALVKFEDNTLEAVDDKERKVGDEDVSFFDSLLPHVKTLTPQNKMLLRIKMQELVYSFVYGDKSNHTSS